MLKVAGIFCILLSIFSGSLMAQAIDPQRSARAAAQSDVQFIAANIRANEDAMYLAQKGVERTVNERLKELTQQMLGDHTRILFEFQQLQTAGTGSHAHDPAAAEEQDKFMTALNEKLRLAVRGPNYDSVWTANLLVILEDKYNELTLAKETVTNPQLKMVVSNALPLVKKEVSQLKTIQKHLIRQEVLSRKEEAQKKKEEALRAKEKSRK